MSEQATGRFWSGIDVPKTIAGTLAAVSAAVLGSFLGVAGTMIGAALAALISSIGTEVYHRSINHGTKRLQSAFVVAPAAVGTPAVDAAADTTPSDTTPSEEQSAGSPDRRIHWKRVALVAGAFFVLGMGVLTTAELFAGRSAADVTSGRETGSPTILFDSVSENSDDEKPATVTPSGSPAADPGETGAPATTTAPAGTPETGVPATGEPTGTPAEPTATTPAQEQPETGVPEQNQDETGDAVTREGE